jgi:hypothetical protein
VPLRLFCSLAELPSVELVSLQVGDGDEQLSQAADEFPITVFDPPLDAKTGAFVDTAAVMANLDLIISSDTAIPHLAGAMGLPVWLALGYSPDWRWLDDGDASPWYRTMRLFRQHTFETQG